MIRNKQQGKAVVGEFLGNLASNEIPKLSPLAQAGLQAGLGGRFGLPGQIAAGALGPVADLAIKGGAGILGGLLSALPFANGGIVAQAPSMLSQELEALKKRGKKAFGMPYKKGGIVMVPMKPKMKKGKRKAKK
jgi:hypothetical protein